MKSNFYVWQERWITNCAYLWAKEPYLWVRTDDVNGLSSLKGVGRGAQECLCVEPWVAVLVQAAVKNAEAYLRLWDTADSLRSQSTCTNYMEKYNFSHSNSDFKPFSYRYENSFWTFWLAHNFNRTDTQLSASVTNLKVAIAWPQNVIIIIDDFYVTLKNTVKCEIS